MARDIARELAIEIGQRMRAERERVFGERSGEMVATQIGCSGSVLSRWETAVRTPSIVDFVLFARALGVPPERILAGLAPTRAEQLTLVGLNVRSIRVVRRLVDLLRERRAS